MNVSDVLANPKLASGVSIATTGTGVGTILDLIPTDIGKLATVVGIVLSMVLIYTHLLTVRKTRVEIRLLEQKEAERAAQALARRDAGQPVRRSDDQNDGSPSGS